MTIRFIYKHTDEILVVSDLQEINTGDEILDGYINSYYETAEGPQDPDPLLDAVSNLVRLGVASKMEIMEEFDGEYEEGSDELMKVH